jgi:hypothetical protein
MDTEKPDIRTDFMSDEEFDQNCANYAEYAFFTPPEQFLFHHYDEDPNKPLICHRPMRMERYVVNGITGGFYGIYDTRDVSKFILNKTWIIVPSDKFFLTSEISELEANLKKRKNSWQK